MRLFRFLKKDQKQQDRSQPLDPTFKYGTHLPVLQSTLEVFKPKGILELGVGKFSTPLFYEYGKKLISIETNERWFQELEGAFPARENFALLHHVLENITERTKIGAIPQKVKDECVQYYRAIIARHADLDFLFIDHVSGLRAHTLVSLYPQFDFVAYHDAEDKGYGYDLFAHHDSGSHLHFVLRSLVPYTGFLIRKSFMAKMPEFKRVLDRHTQEYFSRQYHFDLKDLARAG